MNSKSASPQPSGAEPSQPPLRILSPWNPLDHLCLLGWIFLAPDRLVAYRERAGEEAVKRVGKWLTSTLIWLPLLIPTLALSLDALPISRPGWGWLLGAGLVLGWALTGWLGARNDLVAFGAMVVVAFVVALVVIGAFGEMVSDVGGAAFVVAAIVAGGVAFDAAGVVAFAVACIAAFVMADVVAGSVAGVLAGLVAAPVALGVKKSLETGRQTRLGQGMLVALVLSHATLVWVYFLGGWRVLAGQ
jgi:hypothetical protein